MATTKAISKKASTFVLGRARLEKISAVEGITTTRATREMFAEFDRAGLSADKRRQAIFEKYAKTA